MKNIVLAVLTLIILLFNSVAIYAQVDSFNNNQKNNLTPLFLESVLKQVDFNHPKLIGMNIERKIASAKLLEKQGAFDPTLSFNSEYIRFNSTTTRGKLRSTFQNEVVMEITTRAGLKFLAGSRFNLGSVKSPLSSTGDAGEYFGGIKMPFLRGARINEKAAAENQAKLGESLATTNFEEVRLELLKKASDSYWDWVAAKRRLDVANNIYNLAKFRFEAVQERVKLGDLPKIDGVEAEQELQRRQGNIIKAERDLQKAAFKLSLFLWDDRGIPEDTPSPERVPVYFGSIIRFTDEQLNLGKMSAMTRRPELRAININQDISKIDFNLASNQRMPVLDLFVVPGRDTGIDSVGNTLKFGVNIVLPLRQRTAEGKMAAARLKIDKLSVEQRAEQQRIVTEVADAISAINTTYDRYMVALKEVNLARELERGERQKFDLGDSTIFLVNQRERATAEAEVKLVDIEAEYQQAVAAYRAATAQF